MGLTGRRGRKDHDLFFLYCFFKFSEALKVLGLEIIAHSWNPSDFIADQCKERKAASIKTSSMCFLPNAFLGFSHLGILTGAHRGDESKVLSQNTSSGKDFAHLQMDDKALDTWTSYLN